MRLVMNPYSGEFDYGDLALTRANLQNRFLGYVKEHAPEVLEDLRRDPLKHFIKARLNVGHPGINCQDWQCLASIGTEAAPDAATVKALMPLRKSLWRWSQDNGLDVDWCRATAFFTLAKWSRSATKDADWNYPQPLLLGQNNFSENEFLFRIAWQPAYRSRSRVKQAAERLFKAELEKYLDDIETGWKNRGMVRLKKKHAVDHFYWLILFQVKGKEFQDVFKIAFPRQSGDDTRHLRAEIGELADLIDLPLRPEPRLPGRRPKV